MADRPKNGGGTATFTLLSPLLSLSLAQPPQLWDKVEGQWSHGLAAQAPFLVGRLPFGSPIKGLPWGVVTPQNFKFWSLTKIH
jgi:hypothetical protein